ncbi:MAG: hypothetical protein AAFW76_06940 [Pseudomonadota bacterium]
MSDVQEFTHGVAKSVVTNFMTGLVLSATALLSSDVFFTLPRLSGFWQFEMTTEETSHAPYQGLKLRYDTALIQQGTDFSGTGEKDAEQLASADGWTEYGGAGRTRIEVIGYIERKFLSRDRVILHIEEDGTRRQTSAFMELVLSGDGSMTGTFRTTAANSSGSVVWERR